MMPTVQLAAPTKAQTAPSGFTRIGSLPLFYRDQTADNSETMKTIGVTKISAPLNRRDIFANAPELIKQFGRNGASLWLVDYTKLKGPGTRRFNGYGKLLRPKGGETLDQLVCLYPSKGQLYLTIRSDDDALRWHGRFALDTVGIPHVAASVVACKLKPKKKQIFAFLRKNKIVTFLRTEFGPP